MNKIKRAFALTSLVLFFSMSLFAQIPATTIHDERMGETSEEFASKLIDQTTKAPINCQGKIDQKYKGICGELSNALSGKAVWITTEVQPTSDIAANVDVGLTASWNWYFRGDHLLEVYFEDWGLLTYEGLLLKATAKYGKPSDQGETDWQNGFGAHYTTGHAEWIQPDGAVVKLEELPIYPNRQVTLSVKTKDLVKEEETKSLKDTGPKL